MKKIILFFAFVITVVYGSDTSYQLPWWDTDDNKESLHGSSSSSSYSSSNKRIPFPQCLVSGSKSRYFESHSLQKLFDKKLREEEQSLRHEGYENYKHHHDGLMDYDADDSKNNNGKSRSAAAAAIKLTRDIMTVLACDLNGTDAANLNTFLSKFKLPEQFCTYRDRPDCTGQTAFRTITGVCNNLNQPYLGSAQTAFGRLVGADYNDYLSEPRRKSKRGGYLPSCRKISLSLGSKPLFERSFNNFFVIFGQHISHDISLSTPYTDTYLTPISSCTCDSKYDWNKCTVIDIPHDDPYLRGQKCMAFPATAQAFKDQICSLGVKEQMNGNSHTADLSTLYGSTLRTSLALRADNGLLKSTRRTWAKQEFPPGQREGKSCVDATYKRPCLAGGDSRLMENLLFTGIHTIFLRVHNGIARALLARNPTWSSDRIFEVTRNFVIELYQTIVFGYWVPKLLGPEYGTRLLDSITTNRYNADVSAVVFNEVATAALRCHTLVRDLFSRCTPDGKRIDQLWLHDISHKTKYAYDVENNGIDSILCGAFYDYGFAHDGHYAYQIHHRLFESKNNYGQLWRNDLISINICRGREHGIPSYNSFREYCNLTKAYNFEDFGDTINYDGIRLLQKLYKDVDDVDLYVALNLEDVVSGGNVGRVSACLLNQQFRVLCEGDRFCVAHRNELTKRELVQTGIAVLFKLSCAAVDVNEIPLQAFTPPYEDNNALTNCSSVRNPSTDGSAFFVDLVNAAAVGETLSLRAALNFIKQGVPDSILKGFTI